MLQLILLLIALFALMFGAGPFLQDAGKAIIANRVIGSGTEPKYAAIGTGAGPADSTATALTTEVETRSGTNAGTRVTTTVTNDTYQVINTVSITTNRAITECAFFDASSAGNMFIASGISTINLANGDSLQLTGKCKFA